MIAQAKYMFQRNPNDREPNCGQRPSGGNGTNGNGPPRGRSTTSLIIRTVLIVAVVLMGWYLFQYFTGTNNTNQNVEEIPYSTFFQQVQQHNVKDVIFSGQDVNGDFYNAITVSNSNGGPKTSTQFHFTQLPDGDPSLYALLQQYHVSYKAVPASDGSFWSTIAWDLLPWLLV